ncbi:hypothetical protein NW752_003145 [Fusarium irregulare]|uniref:Heterokaryon incompatibility domain-containing protein n=1 Tax=Fusarium irregulare TaxID=2494466 RepID=A0A9W8UGK3_9HYPO|nr:hypothetical protein NW766_000816 [Fusarium irregulare]KAJ4025671.1 hypothetical protein NW752_003145 [Fusarium irregulare]
MAQIYSDVLENKFFRLATVSLGTRPDTGTEVPSVTLTTHPLGPEIKYNALSYTWGPPRNLEGTDSSDAIILFNGHLFEIQPNLYDALLELRATCSETPIWIDALCINQSDQTERSAQVSVMNQIYGSASRVIVWLGKVTPELEAGVKAAARLGTESVPHTIRMIRTQTWDFSNDLSNMSDKYEIDPIDFDEAVGLATLFSCNYFVRIWVIQEVSLNNDVVVLCNGTFTAFDCIGYTAAFLHYSGLFQQVYALAPYVRKDSFMRDDVNMFEAERIGLFREWCKDEKTEWFEVLQETVDFEAGIGHTQPKSAEMLLLRFLITSLQFRSTDRRDIIYGLGGIIKKMAAEYGSSFPTEFEPNYDIDIKDLLTDVARKIVETTDSLVYLGLVKDRRVRDVPGLPSWVPNFSATPVNSLSGAVFRSAGSFDASKHTPHTLPEQVFTVDGNTLNVSAFCLGKVEKLGEAFLPAISGEQKMNADILCSMEQVYPYTGQSSDEAFWRTLVFDHDLSYRPAKMIRLEDFQMAMMDLIVHPLAIRHREAPSPEAGQALVLEYISQMSYLDHVCAKFPSSIFPRVNLIKSMCMSLGLIPKEEVVLDEEEQKMLAVPKSDHSMPPALILHTTYVGHRPFLTGSGYLGMGLESVEVGDEVWVVRGCPTPLVFRREEEKFSLVGESYVHGVMNGEAVGDDTKWEKIQIV